jgi:Tol biopolymer transport system component
LDKETVFFGAEPSPDGKVIAYNDGQGNGWLYQDGKSRRTFEPEQYGLTAEGLVGVGNPSWSPDGTTLAWVVAGDFDAKGKRYGVAVFDLKQKTARLLHSYQIGGTDRWPSAAVWSPDSQWLAFNAVAEGDDYGLWVAKADGTEKHHLAQDLRSVAWSPDSRFLVFTTSGSMPKAWITEVGSWQSQLLALPPDAEVVAWINPASQ